MQIKDLFYNDRITAFEALVVVEDIHGQRAFPCRVPGLMNLDPAILQTRLLRQATRKARVM